MKWSVRVRRVISDERVRFLGIGAFNTVLGYAIFVVLELTIGQPLGYMASLYIAYGISIGVAFVLHRRFTFRASGSGSSILDFARFSGVYLVALALNTLALPLLVELAGLSSLVAQALVVMFTTVLTYFGHKLFSFRRKGQTADAAVPDRALGGVSRECPVDER